MAEDIYVKIYIKSKVGKDAGKYVNAMDVMATFSTGEKVCFKDTFTYNDSDVYSVFGSSQGNWARMPELNLGIPDWLVCNYPTQLARMKIPNSNYRDFNWITLKNLKNAIISYQQSLTDIESYYKKFEDATEYESLKEIKAGIGNNGKLKSESINFIYKWSSRAKNINEYLAKLYDYLLSLEERYGKEEFRPLFDIEDTVFLHWFRS